ncbi:hypothetical protein AVEN_109485-1 [Araneus ventricosus]|uniref:Uncharacterized protein n=1 Tax=Araneus ventricosus TaxID=182803 RepID=A0A4Y2IJ12_ARAVE|nr:hypothetical protein AVEN_109485-1 [Araneus ventricosus]
MPVCPPLVQNAKHGHAKSLMLHTGLAMVIAVWNSLTRIQRQHTKEISHGMSMKVIGMRCSICSTWFCTVCVASMPLPQRNMVTLSSEELLKRLFNSLINVWRFIIGAWLFIPPAGIPQQYALLVPEPGAPPNGCAVPVKG